MVFKNGMVLAFLRATASPRAIMNDAFPTLADSAGVVQVTAGTNDHLKSMLLFSLYV